jgi:hypothetical protein
LEQDRREKTENTAEGKERQQKGKYRKLRERKRAFKAK